MWLGSGVAVAVLEASSCSSDLTPSLGTCTCCRCSPKRKRKKKIQLIKMMLGKIYSIKCLCEKKKKTLKSLTSDSILRN